MRVKICGVNSAEAYDAARAAGADAVGFVFVPGSPRCIRPVDAAALAARGPGPALVGLFVEPSDGAIDAVLAQVRLNALQVYAPPACTAAIAARFDIPVWRSVPVAAPHDLPIAADGAAALVIEPRAPARATLPGGNAVALDLSLLRGWRPDFPWWLAGGLTPANVAAAIAMSGAPGVDVSSGVETAPGRKSPALIRAFVAAAQGRPADPPG